MKHLHEQAAAEPASVLRAWLAAEQRPPQVQTAIERLVTQVAEQREAARVAGLDLAAANTRIVDLERERDRHGRRVRELEQRIATMRSVADGRRV